jgi:hypothetical protein
VTRESRDQEFAEKRQLFLTEQGYHYTIREVAASGLLPRESFGAQQDSA